jgi:tetratricopeptide (TPR) repeat protein
MHRSAAWLASFAAALVGAGTQAADSSAQSITVLGTLNPRLAQGSVALEAGHYEDGIRLSLAGLEELATRRDEAAGHSNVCAGYAALKRWNEALPHCNRSLELDRTNWRAYNNRAAVFVGLKLYDSAQTDLNTGLSLAPGSDVLHKSLEVVKEHRAADKRDRRHRPIRA